MHGWFSVMLDLVLFVYVSSLYITRGHLINIDQPACCLWTPHKLSCVLIGQCSVSKWIFCLYSLWLLCGHFALFGWIYSIISHVGSVLMWLWILTVWLHVCCCLSASCWSAVILSDSVSAAYLGNSGFIKVMRMSWNFLRLYTISSSSVPAHTEPVSSGSLWNRSK